MKYIDIIPIAKTNNPDHFEMDPFLPIRKTRAQNYGRVNRHGAQSAIQAAKLQREKRKLLQNQTKLALILQSQYRGIRTRRCVVQNMGNHDIGLLYVPKLSECMEYSIKLQLLLQHTDILERISKFRKRRIADVVIELLKRRNSSSEHLIDILNTLDDKLIMNFNGLCSLIGVYTNAPATLQKLLILIDSVRTKQNIDDLSIFTLQLLSIELSNVPSFIDMNYLLINLSKYIYGRDIDAPDTIVANIQALFSNKMIGLSEEIADSTISIMVHIIENCYNNSDSIPDFMEVEDQLHDKFECLSEQSKAQPFLTELFLYNLAIYSSSMLMTKTAKLLSNYTRLSNYNNLVIKLAYNSKFVDMLIRNAQQAETLELATLFSQILSFADVTHSHAKSDVKQIVYTLKRWLQSSYQLRAVDSNRLYEFLSFYHTSQLYNLLYTENVIPAGVFEFEDFSNSNLAYTNAILKYTPQAIPFLMRYQRFSDSIQVAEEEAMFSISDIINGRTSRHHNITIRRSNLVEDAVESISIDDLASNIPLKISLVNQFGVPERGIDGGGLFREFLQDLSAALFLHSGYFVILEHSQQLWYNPARLDDADFDASMYTFMGAVLGKVMTSQILIDAVFAIPLLKPCCAAASNGDSRYAINTLTDLELLDSELYGNLQKLRSMDDATLRSLDLRMCYEDSKATHSKKSFDFIPDGKNIQVTTANVVPYIHYMAHYKLNVQCHQMATAFRKGFRLVLQHQQCDVSMLFGPMELQKLISGDDSSFNGGVKGGGIDVEGLRKVMVYSGGYHPSQPIMQWFWEVLHEFTGQQQRSFLKFMTSCERQPLLGFSHMVPVPCVQQIPLTDRIASNDNDNASAVTAVNSIKLPSSATCMNLLKLPKYTSKVMLKEKLLYAIEAGSGFELSCADANHSLHGPQMNTFQQSDDAII